MRLFHFVYLTRKNSSQLPVNRQLMSNSWLKSMKINTTVYDDYITPSLLANSSFGKKNTCNS